MRKPSGFGRRRLLFVACGVVAGAASLRSITSWALQPEFTVVVERKLTVAEWQQAIDRQDYLVRLALEAEQPESGAGRWQATLNGEALVFEMREHAVPVDVLASGSSYLSAFSAPETLDTRSRLAGAMALVALGLAADGALYVRPDRPLGGLAPWASYVDIFAALGVGRRQEAAAGYPGRVRLVGENGAIVTTIR